MVPRVAAACRATFRTACTTVRRTATLTLSARTVCTAASIPPSTEQPVEQALGVTAADLERYRVGAAAGDAASTLQLSICHMSGLGGLEQNIEEGQRFLKLAANDMNYPEAQYMLGSLYCQGLPPATPADVEQGMKLLQLAGEKDHIEALLVLASMHSNNYEPPPDQELIPLDLEKTANLLIQATDLGDAQAQFNLGMAYGAGRGVPVDTDRALVFVTLAATQGLAAAQFSLAAMYMNGEIVERNNGKGIKWLKLSAEQGEPDAEYFLGSCHLEGVGCARDKAKAMELYSRAAMHGHELAAQALANLQRVKN